MLAEEVKVLACLNVPYLDETFLPQCFEANLPGLVYSHRLPQRADYPERHLNRCLKMQVFERAK